MAKADNSLHQASEPFQPISRSAVCILARLAAKKAVTEELRAAGVRVRLVTRRPPTTRGVLPRVVLVERRLPPGAARRDARTVSRRREGAAPDERRGADRDRGDAGGTRYRMSRALLAACSIGAACGTPGIQTFACFDR